jgi:hypothetical protein
VLFHAQSDSLYDYLVKYAKISDTLDPKVAAELRAVARPRGVSAFVNEAVRQRLQAQRLQHLLAEMDEELGPVSEAIAREVDAVAWPTMNGAADS